MAHYDPARLDAFVDSLIEETRAGQLTWTAAPTTSFNAPLDDGRRVWVTFNGDDPVPYELEVLTPGVAELSNPIVSERLDDINALGNLYDLVERLHRG